MVTVVRAHRTPHSMSKLTVKTREVQEGKGGKPAGRGELLAKWRLASSP